MTKYALINKVRYEDTNDDQESADTGRDSDNEDYYFYKQKLRLERLLNYVSSERKHRAQSRRIYNLRHSITGWSSKPAMEI